MEYAVYRFHLQFRNVNSRWVDNHPSMHPFANTHTDYIQMNLNDDDGNCDASVSYFMNRTPMCARVQIEFYAIGIEIRYWRVRNRKTTANNWVIHTIYHLKAPDIRTRVCEITDAITHKYGTHTFAQSNIGQFDCAVRNRHIIDNDGSDYTAQY